MPDHGVHASPLLRGVTREVAPRGRHREKLEDVRELRHLSKAVCGSGAYL